MIKFSSRRGTVYRNKDSLIPNLCLKVDLFFSLFFFCHRTVLGFVSGIYVYVVAWGLLGQDGGDDLGPESVTQFAASTQIKWRYGNCTNEQSNLIDWINDDDDDDEIEFIIPYCSGAQPNARFYDTCMLFDK